MEHENRQSGGTNIPRAKCVAIVDDDTRCAALLDAAFERQGLRTVVFENGDEAWRSIQASPDVCLVVANWMLPGLDGHRTCRLLAAQRPEIPSVLMLGRTLIAEAWRTMRLMADYVLAKPFPAAGIDGQVRLLARMACGRGAHLTIVRPQHC